MKRSNLVLIAIPLVLFALVVLASKVSQRLKHEKFLAEERQFRETLASFDFVPIAHSAEFYGAIQAALTMMPDQSLTREQRAKLGGRVFYMLLAYHTGSFDHYARFRYPPDLNDPRFFNREYIQAYRDGLADFRLPPSVEANLLGDKGWRSVSNAGIGEVLRLFHDFTMAGDLLQTNVIVCHSCWAQVALPEIRVHVKTGNDRIVPLTTAIEAGDTFGVVAKAADRLVVPGPADILRGSRRVHSAYVRVVVKTETPERVMPILVHFYWVEEFRDWIPYEFANGLQTAQLEHIF